MSASLQEWQQQLESHFEQLARKRDARAPLFALEHPLSADQFKLLGRDLKAVLAHGAYQSKHWLCWVVYAAEMGYEYDGEEFWQSFSNRTPRWQVPGLWRRRRLRYWFEQFQKRYHGIEPSGAWAGQFNIIAWPITHAVLPKDLQYYFAQALYEARYQLAPMVARHDVERVGQAIRAAGQDASARFRQFAQQTSLVGRLALALLGDEKDQQDDLLSANTLQRIVEDLERERSAREWLHATRRQVYRFTGVARPTVTRAAAEINRPVPVKVVSDARPSITPSLQLRRAAPDLWQVFADLPSFAPLAATDEALGIFLRKVRCTIHGSGTWNPGGWLLADGRVQPLRDWPKEGKPLVSFEQKHNGVELVLQCEGAISKGPIWPCLVGDDGIAREVLGRNLRCDRSYLLLHVGPLAATDILSLISCRASCIGIEASQLDLPAALSAPQIAAVEKLGLRITQSVRLWPAGLLPRRWDGEGHGEWLTTERPSFGLIHDSPVDRYIVTLNGGSEVYIKSRGIGQPNFLHLPFLPAGEHRLRVKAVRPLQPQLDQAAARPASLEGEVVLSIREPSVLAVGSTPHGGLSVIADPPFPDLDDLLNDMLSLTVQGPAGRSVTVSVTERSSAGEQLWAKVLGDQKELPATIRSWSRLLDDNSRVKLESASTATISIGGDDLGVYQLRLQHDVVPLRWTCYDLEGKRAVRLIDEAGLQAEPTVSLRRFASPLVVESLDAKSYRFGVAVQDRGGLYVVESVLGVQGLVVSVEPNRNLGLADLRVQPHIENPTTFSAISELLACIEVWSAARRLGTLAQPRRAQVVDAMRGSLIRFFCGQAWWRAECTYQDGASSDEALMRLGDVVGLDHSSRGFVAALRQDRQARARAATPDRLSSYIDVCRRFAICNDPRLCELSLRMASNPSTLRLWAGAGLDDLLSRIANNRLLSQGARLLVLAIADPFSKQRDPAWLW